jgi:TctA family transporter
MMMGLGVVGAQYTNKSEAKLDQTTPIAKLIEESGAIVVPKNSPYKTAVLGSSRLRGFISLALGLAIGLVGLDSVSGQPRLTFGIPQLGDGIDIVVVAVGIFALGEALWVAAHLRRRAVEVIPVGRPWMGKSDFKRSWKPWLRGTA